MNQRHLPDYPVASDKVCPLCGGAACFCVGSENNNYRKFDCEKYNRSVISIKTIDLFDFFRMELQHLSCS